MPKLHFNQKCVVCNNFSPLNTFHWQHTHDKIYLFISHLLYDVEMCKKAFIVHYKNETHNDLEWRKIDSEVFLQLWNNIEVHRWHWCGTSMTLFFNISWISEHIHIYTFENRELNSMKIYLNYCFFYRIYSIKTKLNLKISPDKI